MTRVAIALGSNLGDRDGYLRAAIAALPPSIDRLRVSTFHDTAPVGVGRQPTFLNATAVGETLTERVGAARDGCLPSSESSDANGRFQARRGRWIWI